VGGGRWEQEEEEEEEDLDLSTWWEMCAVKYVSLVLWSRESYCLKFFYFVYWSSAVQQV
jgi:hypothetical protein